MRGKLKRTIGEAFARIRCAIDDERYLPRQYRTKSESDEFALRIEREIELLMQKERFSYKDGKILLPTSYTVVISAADELAWRGVKRKVLESRLKRFIRDRLRSISSGCTYVFGDDELIMEIGRELKKGEIKVNHRWAEAEMPVDVIVRTISNDRTGPDRTLAMVQNLSGDTTLVRDVVDDEITRVRLPHRRFCLEIWRDGICQNVVPVDRSDLLVGRGSVNKPVDVWLSGDPDISRLHAVLKSRRGVDFEVIANGKNPIFVNEKMLNSGESLPVSSSEIIRIGSYALRLKSAV
jgi:FHA domain